MIRNSLRALVVALLLGVLLYSPDVSIGASAGIKCPPQPYQITSNDPQFLDRQFQEIYLRFCTHIDTIFDTAFYNDSVTIDSLYDSLVTYILHEIDTLVDTITHVVGCDVNYDTINDCGTNVILLNTRTLELRDEDAAVPPTLKFFEDTDDGDNFAGIKGLPLAASYTLTLPPDDGADLNEMLVDGSGNLRFFGRNLFDGSDGGSGNVYVDTIRADTSGADHLIIDAAKLYLKNTAGDVQGNGVTWLYYKEDPDFGNDEVVVHVPLLKKSYFVIFPDTIALSAEQVMVTNGTTGSSHFYRYDKNYTKFGYRSVAEILGDGDTLANGDSAHTGPYYRDTITFLPAYQTSASFNVMLTWGERTTSGMRDSFFVDHSNGSLMSTTSFVVFLSWGGTKKYFWQAHGIRDYVGNE